MKYIITLLILFSGLSLFSQPLLTFDFEGLSGNEATANSNSNNVNISPSVISRGPGLTATNNGDRFNSNNHSTSNTLDLSDYVEFSVNPNPGFDGLISRVTFLYQRSSSGPRTFTLRSSLDNYTADINTQGIGNTSVNVLDIPNLSMQLPESGITFRLYSYNATGSGGTGGPGEFNGNDIIVYGVVSPTSACGVALGSASYTCLAETENIDGVTVSIPYSGSNADITAVTTTSGGTVGGDNPANVDGGVIQITGLQEGDNWDITLTGGDCTGETISGTIPSDNCVPRIIPRINEFHYDNAGTDQGEFVEVFVAAENGIVDAADYTIHFVNGSTGSIEISKSLNDITPTFDIYGSYYVWNLSSGDLQNGTEAIALCHATDGIIQLWSYEGTLTGSGGCVDGVASTDVQVSETGSTPIGNSLQFFPDVPDMELLSATRTGGIDGQWASGANTLGFTNDISLLPITLGVFTAELVDKSTVLEWTTLSEEENDLFEVRKSFDGIEWEIIGEINGQGTTDQTHSYRFVDYNVINGTTFYQLKQIDFDGSFSFSDIVSVTTDELTDFEIGAVNKQSLNITTSLEGEASYRIFNSMGEMVVNGEFEANKGNQSIYYRTGELSSGFYIVQINIDGQLLTKKFIVQ